MQLQMSVATRGKTTNIKRNYWPPWWRWFATYLKSTEDVTCKKHETSSSLKREYEHGTQRYHKGVARDPFYSRPRAIAGDISQASCANDTLQSHYALSESNSGGRPSSQTPHLAAYPSGAYITPYPCCFPCRHQPLKWLPSDHVNIPKPSF